MREDAERAVGETKRFFQDLLAEVVCRHLVDVRV